MLNAAGDFMIIKYTRMHLWNKYEMLGGGQGPGDITGLGVILWLHSGLASVIACHDVIFHDCLRGASLRATFTARNLRLLASSLLLGAASQVIKPP